MSKKIFIFLSIAIFVAVIIIGGYYFYKNPIDNNQSNNNISDTSESDNEECEGDQCVVVTETNDVIDGIFQKTENGLLYVKPKDSEEVQAIKMAENIIFSEITFSKSFEDIGERNISLTDFKNGNQISVVVIYDVSSPDEKTVTSISRIITQEAVGVIETNRIIDGIFQKTENGLLYIKPKDKNDVQSIKISEDITFAEITLSSSYENIGEKNMTLADFSDGDSISVFIGFDSENEEIVSKLLRIVVLGSENN